MTDAELLARIVAGDEAAHRRLFDRYYARVFAFTLRRLSDRGAAEEVTADVFFEVWRNAGSFRGESAVSSWIYGIAHLKSLSARRYQRQPRRASVIVTADEKLQQFGDPSELEVSLESREELRQLLEAMEALPESQRNVLRLAFIEGRSYEQIASELGISEANVKTRVNRARARLRLAVDRDPRGRGRS